MTYSQRTSLSLLIVALFVGHGALANPLETVEKMIQIEAQSPGGILLPTQSCVKLLTTNVPAPMEVEVYSVQDVMKAIEKLKINESSEKEHAGLIAFYENMVQRGGTRMLAGAPAREIFDTLEASAPNHQKVTADLRKMAALHRASGEPMQITPILLLGDPGVGKTHYAMQLAKGIGTRFELLAMGTSTAGWLVSGASSQWKGARAGLVATTLIDGWNANPLMVIDEIDKASGSDQYDPMGAFYPLMERESAQLFKDEYTEIRMDASNILWIATANDERAIPKPILNRMRVYVIPKLSPEEARVVAQEIYKGILEKHPKWQFDPLMSSDVLDVLSGTVPRVMKIAILDAFGNAFEENRRYLLPKDLDLKTATAKGPLGFTPQ